jgi:hypothetical protein
VARRSSHDDRRRRDAARRARARREARSAVSGEPALLREVRQRLATGEPLDLLAEVSSLLAVVDPRRRSPIERSLAGERDSTPTPSELLMTFVDVDRPETTALVAAIAQLGLDEQMRAQARRALAARRHVLPLWLRELDRAQAYGCLEVADELGDGEDVLVGVRLSGGQELTALLYVDHNLGSVAKDGFVVGRPLAELAAMVAAAEDESGPFASQRELDPADGRARMEEAIEHGARMFPPLESETWPVARPLIEWIMRLLPSGGHGYERPEWSERARRQLAKAFLASEHGRPFADEDHRSLLEDILWYGTDYGPGDPLHWSPPAVQILLLDWIPRKLMAPPSYLAKAPALLRAVVRYAHAQRDIRAVRTQETLAAIDACEPEYQQSIGSPRPQGPMALLAAMGLVDPDGPWELAEQESASPGEHLMRVLAAEVGGEQALAALSEQPLPDAAFDWSGIPDDTHARVRETLALCDRCCEELLDGEYRTACRRYLAMVARGNPEVFRRRGSATTAAAAVCWTIASANGLFQPGRGGMLVKDLLAHFGIMQGGVSQRALTLMKAAGVLDKDYYGTAWDIQLGTPELLVSGRRRRIIELRELYG